MTLDLLSYYILLYELSKVSLIVIDYLGLGLYYNKRYKFIRILNYSINITLLMSLSFADTSMKEAGNQNSTNATGHLGMVDVLLF